eukprot:3333086-Prymnesium_polylepis.1
MASPVPRQQRAGCAVLAPSDPSSRGSFAVKTGVVESDLHEGRRDVGVSEPFRTILPVYAVALAESIAMG